MQQTKNHWQGTEYVLWVKHVDHHCWSPNKKSEIILKERNVTKEC